MTGIRRMLYVHLCFAVTTPILWAVTLGLASQAIPQTPVPHRTAGMHKKLGRISAIDPHADLGHGAAVLLSRLHRAFEET